MSSVERTRSCAIISRCVTTSVAHVYIIRFLVSIGKTEKPMKKMSVDSFEMEVARLVHGVLETCEGI